MGGDGRAWRNCIYRCSNTHVVYKVCLPATCIVALPATFPALSLHVITVPFSSGEAVTVKVRGVPRGGQRVLEHPPERQVINYS